MVSKSAVKDEDAIIGRLREVSERMMEISIREQVVVRSMLNEESQK
ncbi:MAG: hypothetical protein K2G69_03940 [Muribaculaceae bacterium]|nr:hypothetical protein [Muribaculaceae bacterium]